ncbi:MAG: hypothetical protein WAL25_08550, partial [Acidimicrobiia bacterium]
MTGTDSTWRLFDDNSQYVDRFGLLLLITSIAVITLSLVDLRSDMSGLRSELGQVAVAVFVGATLLLALRASGVARRYRLGFDIVILVGIAGTILIVLISEFTDVDIPITTAERSPSLIWVILSVLAPILVVRRVLMHKRASGQTLLGAVSAYLLLALA